MEDDRRWEETQELLQELGIGEENPAKPQFKVKTNDSEEDNDAMKSTYGQRSYIPSERPVPEGTLRVGGLKREEGGDSEGEEQEEDEQVKIVRDYLVAKQSLIAEGLPEARFGWLKGCIKTARKGVSGKTPAEVEFLLLLVMNFEIVNDMVLLELCDGRMNLMGSMPLNLLTKKEDKEDLRQEEFEKVNNFEEFYQLHKENLGYYTSTNVKFERGVVFLLQNVTITLKRGLEEEATVLISHSSIKDIFPSDIEAEE